MELSNAKYGNISAPVPIVTKARVGEAISDNLTPNHAEYKDNLIQEEYNADGGGSTLNW